ncbi:MAG: CHAT domain-containing protein [Bacteroidetes bacterium]|nr:CHAT domain-containing protein [Bacteroidota bacterium]
MKRIFVVLFGVAMMVSAHAQFGDFGKRALDKAKQKLQTEVKNQVDPETVRARLDSSDFNYAISVIDNSGVMSIKDFGESLVKTANAVSMVRTADSEKTPAQRCRESMDIAEKFYELRRFKEAEVSFLLAKSEFETNGITDNINYSKVLADLGLVYATMGRFENAENFTKQALEKREETLGRKSKAGASSLNNYAVLYQNTGRYTEAEKTFEEALSVVEATVGRKSEEYATTLNNQAILFSKIGRYDQGIEKLKSAIAIMESLDKKNIRNQIGLQSNLALLYQQTAKLTEAEAIYLKLEKVLGSGSPYYAGVLNSLGLLYIQMNKLDKVEEYFNKAANVYKTKLGAQSPNYAKVLNDLGNFYRMQGRFADAEAKLNESLTIRKAALDENHPDFVKTQEDLGILYWKKGDVEKANPLFQASLAKSLDFINRYFPPMSEAEKTKYWDVLQPRFQKYFNYCLDAAKTNPAVLKEMYNYQIATKALLLSSTNKIKQSIFNSGNDDLIRDYKAWLDKKETLARYYSLSKEELQNQKIDLAATEREANQMERSLSERSKEFSQAYTAETIGMEKIAALLGDTEVAVEIIRIQQFDKDFTQESKYAVLVLSKNATAPKLAVLDNGNQLETRYAKFYKNAIQTQGEDGYSYDQYWARIEPLMTGKKTIYLSADGVYNQINVNTLKKKEGTFVLNQFDVITIGNSKDLIALKQRQPMATKKDAFLLGFPDYAGAAPALPGTKVEVEAINKILVAGGYKTTLKEEKSASESAIKALKGPQLMHIATHGYFLPDTEMQAEGNENAGAKNNPLLRSGLILAGAAKQNNQVDLASNDNGVLTAYEAMNLSLDGTDLIVLSACETGLGEVRAGEGVYGLQRAFLVAGANAMIMSLWKVDDAATQQLMTNFYANWSKTGNKQKAFKQAQLQLMAKFSQPYYWGAFVMMGM